VTPAGRPVTDRATGREIMAGEEKGPVGSEKMRVRVYPDEVLRRVAEPVGDAGFDEELQRLARRMMGTMRAEEGVGLAAPQVGVSVRMVVIDPCDERASPTVLVNPVIADASGRGVMEEGCLSVPRVKADVRRRERITVEFETLTGERTGLDAEGLLARVVQHEIDHLDGALFIDRLGPAGRLAVRKALRELEEAARR
jgi:peptide deformylase